MGRRGSFYKLIIAALAISCISCSKSEKAPDPVADFEGNSYKTVKIGTQIWTAENLRSTFYNDGTEIALATDDETWSHLNTPAYSWYNNDEDTYRNTYGALYNGYTIGTGKLCPTGWHIPDIDDWNILRVFLGDSPKIGGKLKETGTDHWAAPNKGADNSSGFKAVGAGFRYFEGEFSSIGYFTCIWIATEDEHNLSYLSLNYNDSTATISQRSKRHGFSVRCVKD